MGRLTKSYPVFDCDAHINDPQQIWGYVPESQSELVRRQRLLPRLEPDLHRGPAGEGVDTAMIDRLLGGNAADLFRLRVPATA